MSNIVEIWCNDCFDDGKKIALVFDLKNSGHVCRGCGRVYQVGKPRTEMHFVDEKSCKAKMRRDLKRNSLQSVSTRALVDRILNPIE